MGELVDDLVKRGYLERIPDPTDGRGKLIRLTEKGWEVHETAFEVVGALQAAWAERIGPDNMAELCRLLQLAITELELDREHG